MPGPSGVLVLPERPERAARSNDEAAEADREWTEMPGPSGALSQLAHYKFLDVASSWHVCATVL